MAQPAIPAQADPQDIQRWLGEMVKKLQFSQLIAAVLALVTRLRDLNTELTKQLVNLRRARPRSERLSRIEGQLELSWVMNGEAEVDKRAQPDAPDAPESEPKEPEPSKGRRGQHPGRKPFPPELERVAQYNPVPLKQRCCPVCGLEMKSLGHTDCEYLDVVPAKVVVVRRTDEALKCRIDGTVVSAPPPPRIVERSILGNRLIIEATADKFLEHQPIERQCLRYARCGIEIAPQTLGRCVGAHLDLLAPLANAIHNRTRQPGLLATDATGFPVLDSDSPEGIRSGTMWCWTNALWVSFFYSPSGDSDSVRRFLGESNISRLVQADGTATLTFIERAGGQRAGCWAHARRGLALCARAGDRVALQGLKLIAPLFLVERDSKEAGDTAEERRSRRQTRSTLIIDRIRNWVDEQRGITLPKSEMGRALGYIHRQWPRLTLFLDDGNIALTNNRRERELRKLVLGRRNWLFTWGDHGGERTANILTIVAAAISHGLNPREYLHKVTQALLDGSVELAELLPDRIASTHPELVIPSFEAPALPD